MIIELQALLLVLSCRLLVCQVLDLKDQHLCGWLRLRHPEGKTRMVGFRRKSLFMDHE